MHNNNPYKCTISGKTETATRYAKSVLKMDQDPQVSVIIATNPQLLLVGENPRLIDEWQE